ncbi:hypothetical protein PoB_003930800 [Plakobranchus ocellatus]|uniref:Uncharacterized protein n=1 Tax=Plakobranchus ocellatus TaxID=259542 RepID=A0AAV4AZS1_9GAST|nr:hypothetical protein PoB_003930800 [Plakobranchus ocellatus]
MFVRQVSWTVDAAFRYDVLQTSPTIVKAKNELRRLYWRDGHWQGKDRIGFLPSDSSDNCRQANPETFYTPTSSYPDSHDFTKPQHLALCFSVVRQPTNTGSDQRQSSRLMIDLTSPDTSDCLNVHQSVAADCCNCLTTLAICIEVLFKESARQGSYSLGRGYGGTVDSNSALRSAVILLSLARVRVIPHTAWFKAGVIT